MRLELKSQNKMDMKEVLKEELKEVKLSDKELCSIKKETDIFLDKLKKGVRKKKIRAEVFIGGSLAKKTIVKKEKQDVDIFVRFPVKYKDEKISKLLEKALKVGKIKARRIHGSRDYFKVKGKMEFEIVPVLKINKPKEARNVTDLSYFHVSYILKQIKQNKKLSDEIILAKTFCHAQKCYGAESYINGFSGYALELMICYYGSFLEFIKAASEASGQLIIDKAKFYKNKQEILAELNEAKVKNPIVFVDPTFKERNALAALSFETFERFQRACKKFLSNPSRSFFKPCKIDEKRFNLILEARINKQEGDIAGSKLLKFYNFLARKIGKNFNIKESEFDYDNMKKARYYFYTKGKKSRIVFGPPVKNKEAVFAFKKARKKIFIKNGRACFKEKPIKIKEFLTDFKKKNKKIMRDMGINSLERKK